MSERLSPDQLSLDEYSHFVAHSRVKAAREDWQDEAADFITGEHIEFLTQHGPGALLLFPTGIEISHGEDRDALRYHMADEMGDMLWFVTDVANRMNVRLQDVSCDSLSAQLGHEVQSPQTFADIQKLAIEHATDISVPNKLGMLFPEADKARRTTSLAQHPNYVLDRITHRLVRGPDQGKNDLSPPTATELEPIQDLSRSLGTYLLTVAFVAKDRLGIDLEDVARFNIAKLQNRAQYGKANDIHFDQTYVRSSFL